MIIDKKIGKCPSHPARTYAKSISKSQTRRQLIYFGYSSRLLQPTQALTNLPSGHRCNPQNRAKIYYVVQSYREVDRAIKQLQARINEVSHGGIHEKFDILFLLNAE